MKLTEQRRTLLEFLAVAEGFVHLSELAHVGASWGAMMQQVAYLRRAGLVGGLADHLTITAAGREAINLPPYPGNAVVA
jgi:hypothetical protein